MYILYFLQSNCLLKLSRYIFILLFDVVLKVLNSSPTLRFRKLRNGFKLNIERVLIVVSQIPIYHSLKFADNMKVQQFYKCWSSNIVQTVVVTDSKGQIE